MLLVKVRRRLEGMGDDQVLLILEDRTEDRDRRRERDRDRRLRRWPPPASPSVAAPAATPPPTPTAAGPTPERLGNRKAGRHDHRRRAGDVRDRGVLLRGEDHVVLREELPHLVHR